MGNASNTGHANNLANLKKIVGITAELGAKYNPVQEMLKPVNIEKSVALGQKVLNEQQAAEVTYSEAVDARASLFDDLDKYSQRVVSIYAISGADAKSVENVKAVHRRMYPQHASKKGAATAEAQPNTRSSAQLGFEDKTSNFAQIASFVEANPKYAANEPELTKEAVRKYSADLIAANDRCAAAEGALESARIVRDRVFYANDDSLYNIFRGIKLYVKGVYGTSSVEYKRISGVEFRCFK